MPLHYYYTFLKFYYTYHNLIKNHNTFIIFKYLFLILIQQFVYQKISNK